MACVLLLFAVCFVLGRFLDRRHTKANSINIMVFNTVCKITVFGDVKADKAYQEIIQKMSALHDLINVYDPESELSHLNSAAFQAEFHCGISCALHGRPTPRPKGRLTRRSAP